MAQKTETRVPCSKETRDNHLRPLKRGGEAYDDLLRRLAEHYRQGGFSDDRGR